MPSVDELLFLVALGLGDIATEDYLEKAKAEDAYEAFVWWRMVRAAEKVGWTVSVHGAGPGHYAFRCGPGHIYSTADFTYARLDHPVWPTIEVHLGIKITGRSDVEHEFDVVALTKTAADQARTLKTDPPWTSVAAHAECKFYGAPVGLGLARGMVGLSADCALDQKGGLASNSGASSSVEKLLSAHDVYYSPDTLPSDTVGLDNDLVARLKVWLLLQGFSVP